MISGNLWKNDLVAISYSYQQKAQPYLELVQTTEQFINAKPGQLWLDLGCGSGRLIESIWKRSSHQVRKIIGLDISFRGLLIARRALKKTRDGLDHRKVEFIQADLSRNLGGIRPDSIDGVTAGLCLSYAEHWDSSENKWDKSALVSLFQEIHSVLKDGGSFIFSTNIPQPNFGLIALRSWRQIILTWKAPLFLAVSLVMLFQSRWLKRAAATGRFHYLPAADMIRYLESTGFQFIRYQLTYAGQAWVFFAVKKT
jgi:SAM-dependent methyltransferase